MVRFYYLLILTTVFFLALSIPNSEISVEGTHIPTSSVANATSAQPPGC